MGMSEPTTQPAADAPPPPARLDLEFRDLGRIGYEQALQMQRDLHQEVREGRRGPTVLLLEHDPVVTVSKRDTAQANLLAGPELLKQQGVSVCRTDRGGDITYHGPGQLVAYPILPLQIFGLNVRQYVRLLEQVIIDTVARFGVAAHRDSCAVGVWVTPGEDGTAIAEHDVPTPAACQSDQQVASGPPSAKLAAIGVRVQRWISMHGIALNVEPNMDHFKLIVPCGLAGRAVTSLAELLGDRVPGMPQVKDAFRETLAEHLLALSSHEHDSNPTT